MKSQSPKPSDFSVQEVDVFSIVDALPNDRVPKRDE